MKAGEIIDRIKKNLGAPWRDATYRDTFKTGGPDTEVTGIATTAFVTLDVIRKASAAGLNMIIPHEDTFWNDRDDQADRRRRRAVQGEARTADEAQRRGLPHPRPHARAAAGLHLRRLGAGHRPRPEARGSARLASLRDSRNDARRARRRRAAPQRSACLRVVGDPKARVSRIRLGVGYASPPISAPDIDVMISGEQQESDGTFDSQPYALDAVTLGIAKGIILLGHTISEEAGMLEMAQWIKGFVPEIPVQLVKAEEPLWGPLR